MHIAYTAEQAALQKELRDYFTAIMTPEVAAAATAGETGDPACLTAGAHLAHGRQAEIGRAHV